MVALVLLLSVVLLLLGLVVVWLGLPVGVGEVTFFNVLYLW